MLSQRQIYWIVLILGIFSTLGSFVFMTTYISGVDEKNFYYTFFVIYIFFTGMYSTFSAHEISSYLSTPKSIRIPISFKDLVLYGKLFPMYFGMILLMALTCMTLLANIVVPEEYQIIVKIVGNIILFSVIAYFIRNLLRLALLSLGRITRTTSIIVYFKSLYKAYKNNKKINQGQSKINAQLQAIQRSGKLSKILIMTLKKQWEKELKGHKRMLFLSIGTTIWCYVIGTYNLHNAFTSYDWTLFYLYIILSIIMYSIIIMEYKLYKNTRDSIAEVKAKIDSL